MKQNFEISLNSNCLYEKENIKQIIEHFSTLNNIKNNIFNKFNQGIKIRIEKLQNLKSRINRLKQCILILNNSERAITIKSKKNYPLSNYNFFSDIFIEEDLENINRIISEKNRETLFKKINSNSRVQKNDITNILGKVPKGNLHIAIELQQLMNLTKKYNDLSLEIYQTKMKNLGYNLNLDEGNDFIYEQNKKLNTEFSFFNKSLLQKKTKFWEIKKEEKTNQNYNYEINNNKNDLLDNLNNKPKIKKQKTIIDEAPKSIISGTKLEKYKPKKSIIQKQTTFEEKMLNLPENIGSLGNIAIITNAEDQNNNNIINNQIEEYFEADNYDINNLPNDEEDNDEFIDNNNNYIYEEETPMDLIRQKNINQRNQNNLDNNDTTNSNYTYQNSQPIQNNNNNNNNIDNNNNNITSTSSIPIPPSVSFPSTVPVISAPIGGSIPVPPPLIINPVIKPVEKKEEKKEEKEDKKDEKEEKEDKKEDKKEEEKEDEKEDDNNKEDKNEEKKNNENTELSMADQIAAAMGKLKKVGDVKVEEKKDNKNNGTDLMSLIKQQIDLRYKNLRKHEEESNEENDDEEEDEDDNF